MGKWYGWLDLNRQINGQVVWYDLFITGTSQDMSYCLEVIRILFSLVNQTMLYTERLKSYPVCLPLTVHLVQLGQY